MSSFGVHVLPALDQTCAAVRLGLGGVGVVEAFRAGFNMTSFHKTKRAGKDAEPNNYLESRVI